eukprot:159781-Hanusia_phi.AAC.1
MVPSSSKIAAGSAMTSTAGPPSWFYPLRSTGDSGGMWCLAMLICAYMHAGKGEEGGGKEEQDQEQEQEEDGAGA